MNDQMPNTDYEKMSKALADEGKIVEAGWVALRATVIPPTAPKSQVHAMKFAYMAGAQHLFSSIITILDGDDDGEPTEVEMNRMDLIAAELKAFEAELRRGAGLPE